MAGSKMTSTTADKMRAARNRGESKTDVAKVSANAPYVWDGKAEDDRPLTREEMQVGIEAYRKQRGRPAGSNVGVLPEATKSQPPFDSTATLSQPSGRLAQVGKRE